MGNAFFPLWKNLMQQYFVVKLEFEEVVCFTFDAMVIKSRLLSSSEYKQ
jgi:hypothetical protein